MSLLFQPKKIESKSPSPTPAEAVEAVKQIARILAEQSASAASRENELFVMVGDTDLEAVITRRPELLTEHGEDLLRIHSMMQMAKAAVRGANGRLRELAPIVKRGIDATSEKTAVLHAANLARVHAHVSAKIKNLFPEEQLQAVARLAILVRAEVAFAGAHPAEPVQFDLVRGKNAAGEMIDVLASPNASLLVLAWEKTTAHHDAAGARASALDSILKN